MRIKLLTLCLFILLGFMIFAADSSVAGKQVDMISDRINFMKMSERNILAIKQSINTSDYKRARKNALSLKKWLYKMISFSPLGSGASTSNSSAASNDIWENFQAFERLVKSKQKGADEMMSAAKNNNKQKLIQAFDATVKSCNSCHSAFRN